MPKQRPKLEVRRRYVRIYGKYLNNFQMSQILGVCEQTISSYRIKKVFEFWSEEDIKYLKENYRQLSNTELGRLLGRSTDSIHKKMSRCGLLRTSKEVKAIKRRCVYNLKIKLQQGVNARREVKAIEVLNTHVELLTREGHLLELINDATENGNTNNHQVILAKQEIENIKKTKQLLEDTYKKVIPSKKKNQFLI